MPLFETHSAFLTLSPDWTIPHVKVFTLLAKAADDTPVSFSLRTPLGEYCRNRLEQLIQPLFPINWLRQVHGEEIVELPLEGRPQADASFTFRRRIVCAVLTADCLPVVLARSDGSCVGVVHAGRRGIENGLLEKMVQTLGCPETLHAWIGPGIATESYPVSAEIRDAFLQNHPDWSFVFQEVVPGQFLMDIQQIAHLQLQKTGLSPKQISGASWNTFTNPLLHSARRDGEVSGRMATVVWMD